MYDVIIIGAGIAGMTAAIYARRAKKSVLVIEEKIYGGGIVNTFKVANWPGEIEISGVDLSKRIYHQMNNLGAEIAYGTVNKIEHSPEYEAVDMEQENLRPVWVVKTDDAEYSCSAVILAIGSTDRELGLDREKALVGKGISYCATCDGAFFKDKSVAVVGGGNTALYESLYLSDIVKKVYLVHRRDAFRGDAALVDKLKAKDNIEFVMESKPVEILGEDKVAGLIVEGNGGNKRTLEVEGVFVAVGRAPATKNFEGVVDLDQSGYVVAGEDCRTSAAGIFVAGDCRTKAVRQLITAASDGAVAATEAVHYLG